MNITMIEGDQRNHKSYQCHSRYSTIDNNTAQYTIQYNTIFYDTIQKQNNTTQYNTTTWKIHIDDSPPSAVNEP